MRLPLFPLHTVLFPHLPLPLHAFEERYRAMVRDVVAEGSPYAGRFVVVLITDGSEVAEPGSGAPAIAALGTIAEVRQAERFADGPRETARFTAPQALARAGAVKTTIWPRFGFSNR